MADDKKKKAAEKSPKPAGGAKAAGGGDAGAKAKAAAAAAKAKKAAAAKQAAERAETRGPEEKLPPRLRERYRAEVIPALMKQFNFKNPMEVPRVMKVTVNMGLGEAVSNAKIIEMGVDQVTAITGQ